MEWAALRASCVCGLVDAISRAGGQTEGGAALTWLLAAAGATLGH